MELTTSLTNLEIAFYIVGIIAMLLWIFIAVGAFVAAYQMKRRMEQARSDAMSAFFQFIKERNSQALLAILLTIGKLVTAQIKKKRKSS